MNQQYITPLRSLLFRPMKNMVKCACALLGRHIAETCQYILTYNAIDCSTDCEIETYCNHEKYCNNHCNIETYYSISNTAEHPGTSWTVPGCPGMSPGFLEYPGKSWIVLLLNIFQDKPGLSGTPGDSGGLYGTFRESEGLFETPQAHSILEVVV